MSKLTPKQERFVAEYLIDLNATQAAIRAGITLSPRPPAERFYVYFLLDAEEHKILYVGKGTQYRMFCHVRDVRSGKVSGLKKHQIIKQELALGRAPAPCVFAAGMTSEQALVLERALIRALGPENLSNSRTGETHPARVRMERLNDAWARLKPLPQAYWENFVQGGYERAEKTKSIYMEIVRELIVAMYEAQCDLAGGK
jgi:hypothetical protein